MSITTQAQVVLEPESQAFVEATATPPFLYELTPAGARKVLDDVQAAPIDKLPVKDRWITVPAEVGDVRVRIVRPPVAEETLPVIVYMHGGGWVLGNADTHDRLVRELAVGTDAAVAFVEYDRSPEAHYPVAIEQGYATAQWIVSEGDANKLDPERIAVSGDSVGGGMTAALALMANERGDVRFVQQSMYYPVTMPAWTRRHMSSSRRATSSPRRRWPGSGTPTSPTSSGARSRSPRRCGRPTSSSKGCRRRS